MKILYAIQGTGNGHLSRAREIVPMLRKRAEVDVLVSGIAAEVKLPFPVTYTRKGLSYIFGKKGGIDILNTYLKMDLPRLMRDIEEIPVEKYDLVINDFEPITAWACRQKGLPCIALSHQSAVLSRFAPKPKHEDPLGKFLLKNYAPSTAQYGFLFFAAEDNIFTPVIRREVREIEPTNAGHYTVYLPAYDDKRLLKNLKRFENIKWDVFSKHNKGAFVEDNISIQPINNEAFIKSLASCTGILCGAGFETPAEALFLKKKLLVIPQKTQYEQHCNAEGLKVLGVPVIKSLKKKNHEFIKDWLENGRVVPVNFPDNTQQIIDNILTKHANDRALPNKVYEREMGIVYQLAQMG
ncbi:MAG: glycosyl transferase [Bacteroidetes bacterium]|nr:glycosyl transferase [Bacteroidota bacterium]